MARLRRRPRPQPQRAPLAPVVYRWDLDKTYLKSEFDTLRELVRVPFEKAEDKVAAPGVAVLIRALRAAAERDQRPVRVYFISASPPQIAREIKKKLELDGIVHDGIVFKDQLQRLMRGKFRHLREHVGYKLTELLKARRAEPIEAREYLFGDDWESDPLIYSLYADVVAGRIAPAELGELLAALRVDPPLIAEAVALAAAIPRADAAARIFINLERRTPPANFRAFGPRLVPAFNYFQTAVCLFEDGVLERPDVAEVARSLVEQSGYSPMRLLNSLADVQRRGHLGEAAATVLAESLRAQGLLPQPARRPQRWRTWLARAQRWLRPAHPPTTPAPAPAIDYRALIAHQRAGPGEQA
jgi:hypothetical protein